ncbi:hypothetical protein BS47DRAFT_1486477 [Hydnum rufescens UP504]|uniref:Uncharacterized protein n=1 Tax=Hydnum rufescens UP504 TaxID=1448309 RepID=A0A9P6AUA4_9AGAM|nr:hypothetical protein BS47DRAFT_1486477 [Hydnum rufescens UP504]
MLNFDVKLEGLLQHAMRVSNQRNAEAPWYGPWGLILTRMMDSGEYLVMFSQPRFFAPAFNSYRTPDFDVSEMIYDPQSGQIFCRPLLIVEVKAPLFPHSLDPEERDGNTDILVATFGQIVEQVGHIFASGARPSSIVTLVAVGRLWQWSLFRRTVHTPTRNRGESMSSFIRRFLDSPPVYVDSPHLHLGTPLSDQQLERLTQVLVNTQQMG